MKAIEQIVQMIRAEHPKAHVEVDPPANPLGVWHLDATSGEHSVVVEWQARHGFGVSAASVSSGLESYGDGAHEHYDDLEQAAARAVTLLRTGETTKPTREVDLRRLRQRCEVSQERLAQALGVSQASVSRIERRSDVLTSTLRRFVEGLGGRLEVRANFGGYIIPLVDEPAPRGSEANKPAVRPGGQATSR